MRIAKGFDANTAKLSYFAWLQSCTQPHATHLLVPQRLHQQRVLVEADGGGPVSHLPGVTASQRGRSGGKQPRRRGRAPLRPGYSCCEGLWPLIASPLWKGGISVVRAPGRTYFLGTSPCTQRHARVRAPRMHTAMSENPLGSLYARCTKVGFTRVRRIRGESWGLCHNPSPYGVSMIQFTSGISYHPTALMEGPATLYSVPSQDQPPDIRHNRP
jgi:hypothetical protein